jgi:uncharacterized cupredoxin-like copper-binding protein
MKRIYYLLAVIVIFLTFANSVQAQKVVMDASGNYRSVVEVKAHRDTIVNEQTLTRNSIDTKKVFVDKKGNTFRVYQSKSGKLFIARKSKNGNWYKSYLTVEQTNG